MGHQASHETGAGRNVKSMRSLILGDGDELGSLGPVRHTVKDFPEPGIA